MKHTLKTYWAVFYSNNENAGAHPYTETAIFTLRRDAKKFLSEQGNLSEMWRNDEKSGVNRREEYGNCPNCGKDTIEDSSNAYPINCTSCFTTFHL